MDSKFVEYFRVISGSSVTRVKIGTTSYKERWYLGIIKETLDYKDRTTFRISKGMKIGDIDKESFEKIIASLIIVAKKNNIEIDPQDIFNLIDALTINED